MWVYRKMFGLYRVCVSFTLCWLSLYGGLPGSFKGFHIGTKVVYYSRAPFLQLAGRTSFDSTTVGILSFLFYRGYSIKILFSKK